MKNLFASGPRKTLPRALRQLALGFSLLALLLIGVLGFSGAPVFGAIASRHVEPRTSVALAPRPPAVIPHLPVRATPPTPAPHRSVPGAIGNITHVKATPPNRKPVKSSTHPAISPKQAARKAHLNTTQLSGTVLILDTTVTGGSSSLEAQAAQALGLSVEVDDASAWAAKTTSDFAQYQAIIFGDPSCAGDPSSLAPAESNASVWGPAVTGNVVVIGTDPVYHSGEQPGAVTLIADGVYFSALDSGHTGAYIDLSCYYADAASGTDVPVLDAISSPGAFAVEGQGDCPNATHIVASSPALAGLSDAALANWSCSTHAGIVSWPSSYSVLAINTDMAPNFTAPDGISGAPYIIATSPVTPEPPLTGPQNGPETYGNNNLAEHNPQNCACDPVNTLTGNFSHTFTDLSIPGRGISLDFSRTYNSAAASQNGVLGYGWVTSYSADLVTDSGTGAVTVTQENGSAVTFNPDGSGGYTAPSRILATLVKNGDGSYTFTRTQDQIHYTFNASGQLVSESDRNGYTTAFTYNSGGQLITVTDSAGRSLALSYDGSGHVASVADPIGRAVAFGYDGSGNLITATDANGGIWRFTYDSNHLLLTMTNPNGGVTTNIYDSSNRVVQQTDPMGRSTTFTFTPGSGSASSTSIRDPNGNITVDQYDNDVLVSETKGYGTSQAATWVYTYDLLTLGEESVTDPNGFVSKKTWDPSGNLVTSTDPLGRTTTYTYDSLNDVTSATDPLGITTAYTYDADGNLLSVSRPLTSTGELQQTTYTYGDAAHPGDVTAMTDPDGKTWSYTYDANGDRASSTDPLGDKTTDTYNAAGWKLSETSPRGNVTGATPSQYTTTYTYDSFGDVTQTTDPLGGVTKQQYDADRNLTQSTDADGHVTKYTYDLDNELTKTTRADGTTLSSTYDADGNQTGQTDGLGHTTTYAYDPLNRLVSTTDPLHRTTTYAYDPAGNRISMTSPDGLTTSYSYDAANQLTSVFYSDGQTSDVSYSYDADGQRLSMSDGTGITSYTYDSLNRLTSSTNGAGLALGYAYDLKGQLTGITYPAGQPLTRAYDTAGRLVNVSDWLGHTSTFRYDADGNLVQINYANSDHGVFTYDHADRLATMVYRQIPPAPAVGSGTTRPGANPPPSRPIATFNYTRDALGQLTTTTPNTIPGQSAETYAYTALSQLSSVTTSTSANNAAYTYDAADNLVKRGSQTLAYDAADELTTLTSGSASTTYTYNQRGNRVSSASGSVTTTYGYDQANRLTSYSKQGAAVTYAYDGDGLRASKTLSGSSPEYFTWDTAEGLPLLLQDAATSFVYGPGGLPLEQINDTNNTVLYFIHDQLGSTRALTTSKGLLAASYAYDAYGAVTSHLGSATNSTPLQFASQYTDAESGLIYLRARYYDPATAQFLTRDPLVPLTKQPYVYANDNPLSTTDPTGAYFALDNAAFGLYEGAVDAATTSVSEAISGQFNLGDVAIAGGSGFVGGFVGEECGALAEQCSSTISGSLNEFGDELYRGQRLNGGRILAAGVQSGLESFIPGPLDLMGIDSSGFTGFANDVAGGVLTSEFENIVNGFAEHYAWEFNGSGYSGSGLGC